MQQETVSRKMFTVEEWAEKHKHPPENTIRRLIFNADKNGFNRVIRRIGRRIYLYETEFFEWLDEQNARASQ
jgi:hypothetical protein